MCVEMTYKNASTDGVRKGRQDLNEQSPPSQGCNHDSKTKK